jgi:bifunctional DNA-binding transcriptional regulator/antitoxin component of YhaV-PrlF toxin-antitoxin module
MKRLGLKPGTRLIAMAVEDAVVLRRADMLLRREATKGIVSRLRPMFSQVPVRGIEE